MEFQRTFIMKEDIRVPVTIYPKCEHCQHEITTSRKIVNHINKNITHVFCSRKCRDAWCYQQQPEIMDDKDSAL